MKKLAATVATGILFAGVTVSNVSAAEVEVHKGDTLWGISRQHNMTVEELMDINNIKSTTIHPDQILVISEMEQYTVKKGDTLSGIGNELGVTVQSLKEANGLKSDLITIGQELKVKDGNTEQVADPVEEAPEENVEISETDAEAKADEKATAQAKADEEAAAQAKADEKAAAQAKADEEATAQAKADEEAAAQAKADEEAAAQAKADEEAAAQAKADEEAAAQAKADEEAAAQAKADEEAVVAQAKADKEKAEAKKETTQVNTETKQTTTTTTEATPAKQETKSEKQAEGKTISVSATAYTAKCDGCSGVTATGVDLNTNPNAKVIAVDPSVIPLGSKVYVEGYGHATAADTGGAIQGNKIDVHVPNKNQAYGWGVKTVKVTIVE